MNVEKRFKIGLALGGGAARGLAHIGVLKALEENGIKLDYISGTSSGAIIGALYCCGVSIQHMEKVVSSMRQSDWVRLMDFSVLRSGLVKGDKVIKLLKKHAGGERDFKEMHPPFTAIATDINTGERVVISKGSLWPAIRASFSIPIIFNITKHYDRYLVDGGLSEMVPVASCREMGADFVIAVNVLPLNDNRLISQELVKDDQKKTRGRPGLVRIAIHTYEIADALLIKDSLHSADFIIEPDTKEIGPADFKKGKLCMDLGYQATIKHLEKLQETILNFSQLHEPIN